MRGAQGGFRDGSDVGIQPCVSEAFLRGKSSGFGERKNRRNTVSIPSSGLKVLVIDDSNTIRRSAEIFLKQGGHDVLLSEDGFDALSKVNDYEPDLIFCDILMPRLDGYQTCAIIKRNARFADVPIVMLSSKDGVFDKARGRMVGSQDYLTKPFTKDQLLQTVRSLGTVKQR
jgi:twitching motility two-component system response regulator PilG